MRRKLLFLAAAACVAAVQKMPAQSSDKKTMKAYMVADAHLDTQWNWDVQTTIRDYVSKTMRQNLYLLSAYPDYIFNFEGAIKYAWMKEYYPDQYERVKQYIANGRWHLAGSSWDANETVVCSSEAWLRNILLGQTYYRQEFGQESTDVFLPDCFGFPYNMPTLMAHCGLIGFSSQKLGWRTSPFFPDGKKYPYTIGLWKGIDGSQVMMVHGFGYGERFKDEDISDNDMLKKEIAESPLNMVYRYYGTGDTGGSADIPSVRALEKGIQGSGPIEIVSATSDQIYKDFMPYDQHPELPVYEGELCMDVHGNACYTSQAAMKLYNRQNEHLGDAAERASVVAEWMGTTAYPVKEMTENFRRYIWHQFHDDLPGTCIPRAYEFSWNDELLSLGRFAHVTTTAVNGIASRLNTSVSGTPVVLYNAEAFAVKGIADLVLPQMAAAYMVADERGRTVPSQVVTDAKGQQHLLVCAEVPATGFVVYSVKAGGKAAKVAEPAVRTLENSVYRLTVNGNGDISSIIDKRVDKEMVAQGQAIGLVVFDDCQSYPWPAWEVQKATLDQQPVAVNAQTQVEMVENGPVRHTLRVTKRYGDSQIAQYIRLYEGAQADRIDFYNEVEWKSLNAMLKMNMPFSVNNEKATYDLGLGSVERGNNRDNSFEVYSHEWTDLTDRDGSYGVTILNDCKYGWDKPDDHTLRLSLLYSPKVDKSYTYQDRQDFGHHEFTFSLIGHQGVLDKAVAVEQSTALNSPIKAFVSPKHKGDLGSSFSFVSSDNKNVTVKALKKAETGDDYIVRVYENAGQAAQQARLTFAGHIVKAVEADGTEKEIGPAVYAGNTLQVSIRPFGVKTYRLTLSGKPVTPMKAESIALPFDRKCFSFNEYRGAANFSGGYSYAAELLPDEGITVDGIPFTFGQKDIENGVTCKGNVIKLPAGNKYNKVYLLAASVNGDRKATFAVGKNRQTVTVPEYTGFVGQWGHDGQTTGYLKDAEVAYVGTHRHSATRDEVYEFTYMFKYGIDIPKGATELVLPDDDHIVVFAATAASEETQIEPASILFTTGNAAGAMDQAARVNLLKEAQVIDCSGEVNADEIAANLIDGNQETKWCDIGTVPNYVVLDLGAEKTVSAWKLLNAGAEDASYITRSCLLQGRNSLTGEWQTLDVVDGNAKDEMVRSFTPHNMRYLRLYVIGQTQTPGGDATRIYEMEVY